MKIPYFVCGYFRKLNSMAFSKEIALRANLSAALDGHEHRKAWAIAGKTEKLNLPPEA